MSHRTLTFVLLLILSYYIASPLRNTSLIRRPSGLLTGTYAVIKLVPVKKKACLPAGRAGRDVS